MSLNPFHRRIATPLLAGRLRVLADRLEAVAAGLAPTQSDLDRAPRLDEWHLAQSPAGPVLVGLVTAHPHCGPGLIHTSPIWIIDPTERWALSLSRYYRLGKAAGSKEWVQ
ncbi:DUF6634 family protein [uncultured Alsobacter sp.]|uniref:DUF6634 family protein n=1 Tax=uncultured Alsobacter sp. TaxID=1748258 RepID=UPI0025DE5521|nr:DUF6634 family protein [uncultured Alsobacter sp.]